MSDPYRLRTKNSQASKSALALFDTAIHRASDALVSRTYGPFVSFARSSVVGLLSRIRHGQLVILSQDATYSFGDAKTRRLAVNGHGMDGEDGDEKSEVKELKATLKVVRDTFWIRLALMADIGFSEAYMVGDVECDELRNVFQIFILNRTELSDMSSLLSSFSAYLHQFMNSRFVNTIQNTLSNISAHYDISNSMFEAFLSKDMTYSCAIYEDNDLVSDLVTVPGWEEEERLLEEAQQRKLRKIVDNARIKDGMKILEIGSGWGSMAILVCSLYDVTIDTLTLSIEQKRLAEQRIAAAGYSDRVKVHLMDYRQTPKEWEGQFDRVLSVEMAEAVGLDFLAGWWAVLDKCLKPISGVGCMQCITIPEGRMDTFRHQTDFMKKYIFPGGELPSLTYLLTSLREGSNGRLICDNVLNIGPHYARTLRAWRRRFEATWESRIVGALIETYPELATRKDLQEVFRRKWLYYWDYTEAGFTMRATGDHILTVTREGNLAVW